MWTERFPWRNVPRPGTDGTWPYDRWLRLICSLLVRYVREDIGGGWSSVVEEVSGLAWWMGTIPRLLSLGCLIAQRLFYLRYTVIVASSRQGGVVFPVTAWSGKCVTSRRCLIWTVALL